MKALVKRIMPPAQRQELRMLLRRARSLGWQRYCPVCSAHLRTFSPDPRAGRQGALCAVCHSMERHRAIWPFLLRETLLGRAAARVLHVAPERCFQRHLRRMPLIEYVTLDLDREDVMIRCDLTKLGFADGEFDLIICNHVLEHIPDDTSAMREMHRVLSSGGQAVITVPGLSTTRLETLESPDVLDPEARLRAYGHRGHVRRYGLDIADRLASCGFSVRRIEYGRDLPEREQARLGVGRYYPIYLCEKPSSPPTT
jgi:SAM-dependent methyltransferase